jgi:hypothetical protein
VAWSPLVAQVSASAGVRATQRPRVGTLTRGWDDSGVRGRATPRHPSVARVYGLVTQVGMQLRASVVPLGEAQVAGSANGLAERTAHLGAERCEAAVEGQLGTWRPGAKKAIFRGGVGGGGRKCGPQRKKGPACTRVGVDVQDRYS